MRLSSHLVEVPHRRLLRRGPIVMPPAALVSLVPAYKTLFSMHTGTFSDTYTAESANTTSPHGDWCENGQPCFAEIMPSSLYPVLACKKITEVMVHGLEHRSTRIVPASTNRRKWHTSPSVEGGSRGCGWLCHHEDTKNVRWSRACQCSSVVYIERLH